MLRRSELEPGHKLRVVSDSVEKGIMIPAGTILTVLNVLDRRNAEYFVEFGEHKFFVVVDGDTIASPYVIHEDD
jgi:hypothetical protein